MARMVFFVTFVFIWLCGFNLQGIIFVLLITHRFGLGFKLQILSVCLSLLFILFGLAIWIFTRFNVFLLPFISCYFRVICWWLLFWLLSRQRKGFQVRVHDCRFVVLFQGVVHVYHDVVDLVEDAVDIVGWATAGVLLRGVYLGRVWEVTFAAAIVWVFRGLFLIGVVGLVSFAWCRVLVASLLVFRASLEPLSLLHGLDLDLFHSFDLLFFLNLFHLFHSFVLSFCQFLGLETVALRSSRVIQYVVWVDISKINVFTLLLVLVLRLAAISSRWSHFTFFVPRAIFLLLLSLILL